MLDKRLKLCADMVKGNFVCDVGTDHAYIVSELLTSGKCSRAIAADINEKPLKAAEKTLQNSGVISKAELILSDGLKNVPLENVTDIVIAGMGGELIAKILSECDELDGKNLILQPMTRSEKLIKFLYKNGFEIIAQKAVSDGKFFYTAINAVKTDAPCQKLTPVSEYIGKLDFSDEVSVKFAAMKAESILRSGRALSSSGHSEEAAKKIALANKIILETGGKTVYTVKDILTFMDVIAPMKNLHKGDNSGLLVGDENAPVTKILFSLDITCEAVREAAEIGAEVIISHHPVIFHPLYNLNEKDPACLALKNNISCICFHSPLDMADGGINDIIFDMLDTHLKLKKLSYFEPIHPDGRGYGFICSAKNELMPAELAKLLKEIFKCTVMRFTDGGKPIKKLAFCSGGGGSDLPLAIENNADAYITGDVKHDTWITARNNGISLYDCGHFHTEDIVIPYLIKRFSEEFSGLGFIHAASDKDPVNYIL